MIVEIKLRTEKKQKKLTPILSSFLDFYSLLGKSLSFPPCSEPLDWLEIISAIKIVFGGKMNLQLGH